MVFRRTRKSSSSRQSFRRRTRSWKCSPRGGKKNWGRLTHLGTALARTTESNFNVGGQTTSTKDGLGKLTSFTYNSVNEMVTQTDPLNHAVRPDSAVPKVQNRTSVGWLSPNLVGLWTVTR